LFSPAFHPAMKAIMPVRNALGVRTVFNMLGPLSNPATPPFQLIGAFSKDAAKLMAETLSGLPIQRAFVVHGAPSWDEATPIGEFHLYDVTPGKVSATIRQPEDYGLNRCSPKELLGKDAAYNAKALELVFSGDDKGAHYDALLMGSSLVLEVMGKVENPKEGVQATKKILDNGEALAFLNKFKAYFSEK